ncbi:hypothetical protein MCEGE10_01822 [Flavobacteriaceae bacterium]
MYQIRKTSKYMIENFQKLYRNLRQSHSDTKYDTDTSKNNFKKTRFISKLENTGVEDILKPVFEDIMFATKSINLAPESLCFLVHLDGHNKNLLYFLLCFHVNSNTLEINWNNLVIDEYADFCETLEIEKPSKDYIKDIIKELAKRKVITNIIRGKYMLNPILIGGIDEMKKEKLMCKYSQNAIERNKAVYDELFPVIYNFKAIKRL